jgi:hypothetical protein
MPCTTISTPQCRSKILRVDQERRGHSHQKSALDALEAINSEYQPLEPVRNFLESAESLVIL